MRLEDFVCFEAVKRYLNFTEAAEHLFISQSALSKKIKALEDDLGAVLFERKHSTIKLTPVGECVAVYVDKILNEHHKMVLAVKEHIQKENQKLKLASFYEMAQYGIADLIVSFEKDRDNNFHVESQECDHQQMVNLLDTRQTDLVIGYLELWPRRMGCHCVPLVKDELVLVVNNKHPLAEEEYVSLKNVVDERFCFPREDDLLFKFFYDTCKVAGFAPKLTRSDVRLGTIKRYITEGLRVTLHSRTLAQKFFQEPQFHLVNIEETPSLTLAILTKEIFLTGYVKDFIIFAKSYYANPAPFKN